MDEPATSGTRTMRSNVLLLLAAMIWGFGFVAQRAGMEHVGPFLFNGLRFALGTLVLLPFVRRFGRKGGWEDDPARPRLLRSHLLGSLVAGTCLFAGASLQQMGIVYTTAGKAGFITGLYVVIVPLLALFWGHRPSPGQWLGAGLAASGLYLLSITGRLAVARGDLLVLAGAIVWAIHVHLIAYLVRGLCPLRLAAGQFTVTAGLSLAVALLIEPLAAADLSGAAVPILYAGALSVAVAYTLQVVAQRDAHPAHAAIVLSLEAVFAAAGGWLILGEGLTARAAAGCTIMLAGMLCSQLPARRTRRHAGLPRGAESR
jgi:drug/metabolite transporter (DMT)-like permease